MGSRARTLLVAAAPLACLGTGCRENVYLGNPVVHEDASLTEAAAQLESGDDPDDAGDAPPAPVRGYLHAQGATIYDESGGVVRLKGVNWAGMETDARVPDGLHRRKLDSLLAQVAGLGFNLIRIPYSNASLARSSHPVTPVSDAGIGISPIAANPDLEGMSSLEILDRIVERAAAHGLWIMLDRFRFDADRSIIGKWYSGEQPDDPTGGYPESKWIADWTMLAERYATHHNVIGFDLHEEPHNVGWADGGPGTDWRAAAEKAGNQILTVNPKLLIVIEGVEKVNNFSYWSGGNLGVAFVSPVHLTPASQLVYSIHDYGRSVVDQSWFSSPMYPRNLRPLWDAVWGYLVVNQYFPVFVGSFGDQGVAAAVRPDVVASDMQWRDTFVPYMDGLQVGYAFWSLNPSAEGKSGLLQPDWQTPDPDWSSRLQLRPTFP
jgi:endoglucanase